jgi:hypothetical protein
MREMRSKDNLIRSNTKDNLLKKEKDCKKKAEIVR